MQKLKSLFLGLVVLITNGVLCAQEASSGTALASVESADRQFLASLERAEGAQSVTVERSKTQTPVLPAIQSAPVKKKAPRIAAAKKPAKPNWRVTREVPVRKIEVVPEIRVVRITTTTVTTRVRDEDDDD